MRYKIITFFQKLLLEANKFGLLKTNFHFIELIRQVAISEETLNEVVQDIEIAEPHKYKGYIKKLYETTEKPKEETRDPTLKWMHMLLPMWTLWL